MFLRSIQIFQHFCQSVILISNQPFISSRIVCSGIAWIYPLEVSWQDYLHAWPSAPWGCWVQATASIWKAAIWWVWDQGCKLPSWGGTMLWCVYSSLCLKGSWCFFTYETSVWYNDGYVESYIFLQIWVPEPEVRIKLPKTFGCLGLAFYQNNNQLDSFSPFWSQIC